jgi:hypothetical protein
MHYAAIGLNCGVASNQTGDILTLRTTWSPRFVQPRIIPRAPNAPVAFADLASEHCRASLTLIVGQPLCVLIRRRCSPMMRRCSIHLGAYAAPRTFRNEASWARGD